MSAGELAVVGKAESLDGLLAEYERGNRVIQAKIRSLQARFRSLRRIRGDGNCFYRAFAVGLLLCYPACSIADAREQQRQRLVDAVRQQLLLPVAALLPELTELERRFVSADALQRIDTVLAFLARQRLDDANVRLIVEKTALDRRELTDALVDVLRLLAARRMRSHEADFAPFLVDGDLEHYVRTQVLCPGVEGEGLAITALTDVFRDVCLVNVHLLNSDATDTGLPAVYTYPSPPVPNTLVMDFLFRPGHYDLLLDSTVL